MKTTATQELDKLTQKYEALGQEITPYLEGLYHSNFLTYWDYIHLDTLLTLQIPKTHFPDEKIFIMYHQITELYFGLVLLELEQLQVIPKPSVSEICKRISRIIGYFKNLTGSFDVMVNGMDPEQFLKFRLALLPASGFQSVQYRKIEFRIAELPQLIHSEIRNQNTPIPASLSEQFDILYWKFGNLDLKTGQKTLTLKMFEEKYNQELLALATEMKGKTIWAMVNALPEEERNNQNLINLLKQLDLFANVFWSLSHYKSAVKYLHKDLEDIQATGGTNWQKFLPPRFQRIQFFPECWTKTEIEEWGKGWVMELFNQQVEQFWKTT
jgi:tryptophan 2,3-dioxygenase